jgi:acyl-CoA thioesterase FadM
LRAAQGSANAAGAGSAAVAEAVGGELLLDGRVRAACLDAQTYRPRPLPQLLWKQINAGDR